MSRIRKHALFRLCFAKMLEQQIVGTYRDRVGVVSKLSTSGEKFPVGFALRDVLGCHTHAIAYLMSTTATQDHLRLLEHLSNLLTRTIPSLSFSPTLHVHNAASSSYHSN